MRIIVFTTIAVLAATALLGLWLQSIGVYAGEGVAAKFNIPAAFQPIGFPAVGGLVALTVGVLNYDAIARQWRAERIEKETVRPALALLFAPVMALLMQIYIGLAHFELTTKPRMLVAVAILQVSFFFVMGNYATTLRPGARGGLRTPWTMKSDRVWAKTHRFIGRGLIVASLAGAAGLFFLEPRTVIFGHVVAIIGVKTGAALYSYMNWRDEFHQHAL